MKTKTYVTPAPAATTAQVTYTYDDASVPYSIGRLTKVDNVNKWQILSYDPLGRPASSSQTTNATLFTFSTYGYNRADKLTSIAYPSGRTITTAYDQAGRISGVSGLLGSTTTNYAPSVTYASHRAISVLTLRNSQMTEQTCYNNRLQPTGIRLGTAANGANICSNPGSDLLNLAYAYGTTNNNGNLVSQTIARPGQTWTESYTAYDGVNRLTAAAEGAVWSHTYVYDNFGNRAVTAGVINAYATPTALTQYTNNQWLGNGLSYDAAGDQTALPSRTFTYDAENRLVASTQPSTAAISYSYDGDGRRVMKTIATTPTPTVTTYVYDAMGQLAAEYGAATDSGTSYLTTDHLGSTRVVTDSTGTIKKCYDYYSFGEDIAAGTGGRPSCFANGVYPSNPDTLAEKFTGKERDAETGLDYFGARYLSAPQGRFTSPDAPFADQGPSDPQSWNMYAYVRNNPLKNTDPNGRGCQNGFEACLNYIWGGAKSVINTVPNAATAVNRVIDPTIAWTGFQFGAAPTLQPANEDQREGMEAGNAVMLVAPVVSALGTIGATSGTVSELTTVSHYTSEAGVAGITESGGVLRSGTYVTVPGEIPAGASSSTVENLLEVGPGKGANSITFQTPSSNLTVPANGGTTSGGAVQFQLKTPTQVNPANFKPTPPPKPPCVPGQTCGS